MVFGRRNKETFWDRTRNFLYPRKGFWRGVGYIKQRMKRLPDTPHRIALGFACGAFASFTPFFTLHFFVAAFFAWILRANMFAALAGTIVGNPFTITLIASSSLWLGRWILGQRANGSNIDAVWDAFGTAFDGLWATLKSWVGLGPAEPTGLLTFFHDLFLPYLVGGAVWGFLAGAGTYVLLWPLVAAYQAARQRRFDERAAARRREADREQAAYAIHDTEGDNA
ncbi:MAG: DUF2062 domain-containing protein [Paracoccaceae bacterium]